MKLRWKRKKKPSIVLDWAAYLAQEKAMLELKRLTRGGVY